MGSGFNYGCEERIVTGSSSEGGKLSPHSSQPGHVIRTFYLTLVLMHLSSWVVSLSLSL